MSERDEHTIPCLLRNRAGPELTDHRYCACPCHAGEHELGGPRDE